MTIQNSMPYTGFGVNAANQLVVPVGLAIGASGSEVSQPVQGAGIAAGSTLVLTEAAHNGALIKLDTAAGSTVTLPASTGKGARYRFMVSVLATSNNHIVKVANSTDVMQGIITTMSDDPATAKAFGTAATSDTITLNRTTTGSVQLGEYIELEDYAAGFFRVLGFTASTGTEATPFSATV